MNQVDIYLDVDGVLNACGPHPADWGWGKSEVVIVNGFAIRYSPAAVRRFNDLSARGDVNMYWLTTWEHTAGTMICPAIGLNGADWPVLDRASRKMSDYSWWKLHAAYKHFESNDNRAIWIDDDLFDHDARDWAQPYVETGQLLLVQPRTERALTMEEFDTLEAWIDAS